jgi:AcrR family transcriptional regulator
MKMLKPVRRSTQDFENKAVTTQENADQNALAPQSVRRRGRPPKREAGQEEGHTDVTRQKIIEYATELSREVPLEEISIVRLAKELSVTPATIHYHLNKGRDELISEVVTQYMRHLLCCFDDTNGAWEEHVLAVSRRLFKVHTEFKGVNAYLMSHNKFRLLQTESKGEQDLGVRYLDRFIGLFTKEGYDIDTSVTYMHQLAFFIASCAQGDIRRQFPSFHEKYLRQEITPAMLVNAPHFQAALEQFVQFSAQKMFDRGIDLLIRGFKKPVKRTKQKSDKF